MKESDNPFRRCLESGHFAVTAELVPPRNSDLAALTEAARTLKPAVSAINLTDGAGARVRMSSLAAAIHIRQQGVEPVLQMTCRDRNRIAIQGDLLGAAAFGIRNLLILTGDDLETGDEPDAIPVFDFNSQSLLEAVRDFAGNSAAARADSLRDMPDLYCGAADVPLEPVDSWAPTALLAKADAGARFVQTQFCFDMRLLSRYMQTLERFGLTERLYFLAGLGPLRSAQSACWMRDNLFGTVMPNGIIRRMEAARDPHQEGIEICAELMNEAREIPGIAGVHLMAPGQPQAIVEAVRLSGML